MPKENDEDQEADKGGADRETFRDLLAHPGVQRVGKDRDAGDRQQVHGVEGSELHEESALNGVVFAAGGLRARIGEPKRVEETNHNHHDGPRLYGAGGIDLLAVERDELEDERASVKDAKHDCEADDDAAIVDLCGGDGPALREKHQQDDKHHASYSAEHGRGAVSRVQPAASLGEICIVDHVDEHREELGEEDRGKDLDHGVHERECRGELAHRVKVRAQQDDVEDKKDHIKSVEASHVHAELGAPVIGGTSRVDGEGAGRKRTAGGVFRGENIVVEAVTIASNNTRL